MCVCVTREGVASGHRHSVSRCAVLWGTFFSSDKSYQKRLSRNCTDSFTVFRSWKNVFSNSGLCYTSQSDWKHWWISSLIVCLYVVGKCTTFFFWTVYAYVFPLNQIFSETWLIQSATVWIKGNVDVPSGQEQPWAVTGVWRVRQGEAGRGRAWWASWICHVCHHLD